MVISGMFESKCLLDLGEDFEALARSKGEVRIHVEGFMKQL